MMEDLKMEPNIGKMTLFSNSKRALSTCALLVVAMLFFACHRQPKPPIPPDYGAAYNNVRDSLEIRRLSPDWTISKYSKNYANITYPIKSLTLMYDNPEIDSTLNEFRTYYAGKTLGIENDTLKYESDNYGIIRFPTPARGIIKATLSYIYSYYPDGETPIGMRFVYLINPHPELDSLPEFTYTEWIDVGTRYDSDGRPIPMTRAEADSILATWGMKYP